MGHPMTRTVLTWSMCLGLTRNIGRSSDGLPVLAMFDFRFQTRFSKGFEQLRCCDLEVLLREKSRACWVQDVWGV